jgi:hypothetical protein
MRWLQISTQATPIPLFTVSYLIVICEAIIIYPNSSTPQEYNPYVIKRATSEDASCPSGYLCVQEACPNDIKCPEGEVCINFEGAIACAAPGFGWCAFNPTTFQAVACSDGLCW